tara:strand:+ start:23492 stop:25042 length:1551 start_codon:yes stop_codon:yes gene_type:complete
MQKIYLLSVTIFLLLPLWSNAAPTLISGSDAITFISKIKTELDAVSEFNPDGIKYGNEFTLEISNDVSESTLWQVKANEQYITFMVSEAALKNGMSLERWLQLYAYIYAAHSWRPMRLMNQQQVLADPNASPAEKYSLEINSLNLLKELHTATEDSVWGYTRAISMPEDRHSKSYKMGAYLFLSVANALKVPIVMGTPTAELREPMNTLAKTLGAVLNEMIETKKAVVQQFVNDQNKVSRFQKSSVKVSDLLDHVRRNDRKGAAQMLESSLPWDLFTAAEMRLYTEFIESIRHPNWDDSIYLLRGTNAALDPNPEADGLSSKLFKLDRHQNLSVNEVFTKYREEWGLTAVNRRNDIPFPSFFNFGENHSHSSASKDGFPSGLISTSLSAPVVSKFAKGSKVMIRVDSRRMYPNFESMMYFEREVLIPFFVFPDEVEGLLVKDPTTKKSAIIRTKDQSINVRATDFLIKNMAKDALAEVYNREVWKKAYQSLFPKSFPELTSGAKLNQCIGFYRSLP